MTSKPSQSAMVRNNPENILEITNFCTLEYLISVWYGINILGGKIVKINKRMVWNNQIGWKFQRK